MAFSGRLGGTNSQPGALRLGSGEPASGGGSQSSFFVADAVFKVFGFGQGQFTADAVIKTTDNPASFTVDAYVAWWVTADAVILRSQSGSFTADANIQFGFTIDAFIYAPSSVRTTQALASVLSQGDADLKVTQTLVYVDASPYPDGVRLRVTQSVTTAAVSDTNPPIRVTQSAVTILQKVYPQFTADAVIKNIAVEGSFTADASLAGRFLANAVILRTVGNSMSDQPFFVCNAVFTSANVKLGAFVADAYLTGGLLGVHDRTIFHSGYDHVVDHVLFTAIGRYPNKTPAVDVLIDLDARITAMEAGAELHYGTFTAGAVTQSNASAMFTADAYLTS